MKDAALAAPALLDPDLAELFLLLAEVPGVFFAAVAREPFFFVPTAVSVSSILRIPKPDMLVNASPPMTAPPDDSSLLC